MQIYFAGDLCSFLRLNPMNSKAGEVALASLWFHVVSLSPTTDARVRDGEAEVAVAAEAEAGVAEEVEAVRDAIRRGGGDDGDGRCSRQSSAAWAMPLPIPRPLLRRRICTRAVGVGLPDERSEEPCKARSQEAAR